MKKAKKKKKVLSAEERLLVRTQREHAKFARDLFKQTGFSRLRSAAAKEFTYEGITSDFDDVFINENVIVVIEYTIAGENKVSDHLKGKSFLYNKIHENGGKFVKFIKSKFPETASEFSPMYKDYHYQIRIVYASRFSIKAETKNQVENVIYLDYNYLRYFANVASTVKLSARFELMDFLQIDPNKYAHAILAPVSGEGGSYEGSVLPEAHSHFPEGFKVVSFYVDAEALLERAYVLRRDGWRGGSNVYQRMISRKKVEAIRRHLLDEKGVFVNNIIVTLPDSTKLLDSKMDTIDVSSIQKTTSGKVRLPSAYNSIGLIDGQHRVFSYHEGGVNDSKMSILRKQQNLLATGIIFPNDMSDAEKTRFEARLFLEINSNQTNAKSDLKQEIGLILRPYSPESIAKRVINHLNDDHGSLNNKFQRYFYDKGKLKTTTVVSYGLRPLVRVGGEESLFNVWSGVGKEDLLEEKNDAVLAEYIYFCAKQINAFFSAAKSNIASEKWSTDKKMPGSLLNTTFVNGLIFCFRRVVKNKGLGEFEYYKNRFSGIEEFSSSAFKSSQYNQMGESLYNKFFDS